MVYNMAVDGNHNYFVTKSKVLVHNKSIKEQEDSQTDCKLEKLKSDE
ncbi:hypothetical protein [uncultured Flavobacterium sp.]